MLSFDEFIKTPWCKPLVLEPEDEPQDVGEWKKLERSHQAQQYAKYQRQFESETEEPVTDGTYFLSSDGVRVFDKSRNSVTLQENGSRNKKSRAEYMRAYRRRPRKCPHCGEKL